MHRLPVSLLAATLVLPLALPQAARAQQSWTGTWGAASSAVVNESGSLPEPITYREVVHVSRGGRAVRVTFTNELGTDPLRIAGAQIGLRAVGGDVVPGSDKPLLFGGQTSIEIPPGAVAVSDAAEMKLAPLTDVAVTLLLPQQPLHIVTAHPLALTTNYAARGDALTSPTLTQPTPIMQWRFLKNIEVSGGSSGAAIVAFGDSITDGHASTPDANRRWPDELAKRLQADKRLNGLGVLNEGISGNRLLHDVSGPNALARFDRDVLSQSRVRYLVLLEGINDIGRTAQPRKPGEEVTAQQIIWGYEQIIERAHAHGIKVYGATLTPFLGAAYATPAGETMRQTVNAWTRTPGHFDGVVDFDQITRDPAHPGTFLSTYECGDHLHPSDAGYKAMGDSIDLQLFTH